MAEPYRLTASEVLTLLKDGNMTVEQYANSLLSRIAQRDDVVKAWAHLDRDSVLAQARGLDAIPMEDRGPLHGLAVGVKDMILTKDLPTKFNSPIYEDNPAIGVDAAPVITLRAAGALIFGKTTTTEFASTTDGGPTTNPHDHSRTPGGSSSGSGAAVADFQVPIALGTQTGGSVIRPGSFNSIHAFKPTWGAISREGLAQYSMMADTLGFYARSVQDLKLLSSVFKLKDDEPVQEWRIRGKTVAFVKTHVWKDKATIGLERAWEKAKTLLEEEGANVEEVELPNDFAKVSGWAGQILAGEGRTSFLGNYLLAKDKLHPFLQDNVENASGLTRRQQLDAYDNVARLRPIFDDIARRYDAVITPSVPDEAPVGIKSTGDPSFCSMWTILHVPCLNLPGFEGKNGMPIGLTLLGARYTDEHILHIGTIIGEIFTEKGGFVSKIP